MCSVWSWMMRRNWRVSAGSSRVDCAARVSADPLTDISGDRSSWLTIARNSARSRSCSSRGAMSCRVTTKDATWPSSAWMGEALSRTLTLRPSGTLSTISSARTVSPALSTSARGSSPRENSRPSARTKVIASSRVSGPWPSYSRPSTMRMASRLIDTGAPVRASRTTTPTGEVLTSVSRSALA